MEIVASVCIYVYIYIYMKVCVTGMMKLQQKRELQRGKPRLSPGRWRVRRRRSRGNNLEGVTGDRGRVGGGAHHHTLLIQACPVPIQGDNFSKYTLICYLYSCKNMNDMKFKA